MSSADSAPQFIILEDLYHPSLKVDVDGKPKQRWLWISETQYLNHPVKNTENDAGWSVTSIGSETATPLYEASRMRAAVQRCVGAQKHIEENLPTPTLNADATSALVICDDTLYRYSIETESATELSRCIDKDVGAEFSPDNRWATCVRENNLNLIDLETNAEKRLTNDGSPSILNGRLDWVYQEELYGRENFKGYWWSPDSTRISFLRLNVSNVSLHTISTYDSANAESITYRYPKAGRPNPIGRLGIFELGNGKLRWIDFPNYDNVEHLIVDVTWSPNGHTLSCQVQNREQTWLDLYFVEPATGSTRRILRETSVAWVRAAGPPHWCDDGSFVWTSDRSGWSHLYHYDQDGTLIRPITSGFWDVREILGIKDGVNNKDWIYFSATEHSPISIHTYRVRLDGTNFDRLTTKEGTHQSKFSPDKTYFIDTWSNLSMPSEVRLHDSGGLELRQLETSTAPSVSNFEMGTTERFQVRTRDGFTLEALMIKPPDFNPDRKYPVLCHVYGGPSKSMVQDIWGGRTSLWHHMLSQRGAIIWIVDNRSASAKGMVSAWPVYRNFGSLELKDLEDSINWLSGQRYVERDRIGIWGWSFGGYLAAYAMTHSTLFRIGIAGAPVTDWMLYDTIYTERYMLTPEHNPDGYRTSSVLEAASHLHGKLLILHGTMDENVHIDHSMCLIRKLQQAGKDFDVMFYPGARHEIEDDAQLYDVRRRMTAFITDNL